MLGRESGPNEGVRSLELDGIVLPLIVETHELLLSIRPAAGAEDDEGAIV